MHYFDLNEKLCHMVAIWLVDKVAYQNNRAVEEV